MLSIAKLSSDQGRYYLEGAGERVDVAAGLAEGAEDYYLDPLEAKGRWAGAAARTLGLGRPVEASELRRLLAGLHPATGEPLRTDGRTVAVAAFDLTFSAPKSVSVLMGVGPPAMQRAVRAAHQVAVGEAMAYFEANAAAVRRGAGGACVEQADGLVIATFRHRSSRAGDPQLHTHAVVANVACGPDGRWSALDGRRLYAHAPAVSRVYQAVLRGELTRTLGVEWTPVSRGIAEVAGVPVAVRRAFSRRRVDIETALAERGTSGHRASEVAALATRRRKDRSTTPADLVLDWQRRAAEFGWSAERCSGLAGRSRSVPAEAVDEAALRLVREEELTARSSTFCRRDVTIALCEALPPGAAVDRSRLEAAVDRILASPDVVPLIETGDREAFRTRDGRVLRVAADDRRYTTAGLLAVEQRLVAGVEEGRGAGRAVVSERVAEALMPKGLSEEQRAMVLALTTRGNAIDVVAGRAGTGKTFALAAAHAAWREAGTSVLGVAVARRAARELEQGSGVPSTSVAAMLGDLGRGRALPVGCVVIVDEAGMLGTRDTAKIAAHVEAAAGKLVLVGDPHQLPEIDAGGFLRGIVRRGQAIELTENRRQAEVWEREAVDDLRNGDAGRAIAAYQAHDRIHVSPSPIHSCDRLVDDWWRARSPDAMMIAARRSDVDFLNMRARERMRQAGRLGDDELRVGHRSFAVGDHVVIRRNDLELDLVNGERAVVAGVDPIRHRMTLTTERDTVAIGSEFFRRRASDGNAPLAHGYAITCHAAQGATFERAFVLADAGLCREWGYTALTRGRRDNHLYLSDDRALERDEYGPRGDHDRRGDAITRLTAALERSDAEPLALDRGVPTRAMQSRDRGLEIGL